MYEISYLKNKIKYIFIHFTMKLGNFNSLGIKFNSDIYLWNNMIIAVLNNNFGLNYVIR